VKSGGPVKLTEAQIERQITDFLALDDWRAIKTEASATSPRGGRVERGTPDVLYIRYRWEASTRRPLPLCEAMWIEHKAPGGKVSQHQRDWHQAERARGALVVVATEDFAPSLDGFAAWYRQSGIMRRKI
jgi:hypothetical protein